MTVTQKIYFCPHVQRRKHAVILQAENVVFMVERDVTKAPLTDAEINAIVNDLKAKAVL